MSGKNRVVEILFYIALILPAECFAEDLKSLLVSTGQEYIPVQKGDLDLEYSTAYAQNTHDIYSYFGAKYRFFDVKEQAFRNTLSLSYGLLDRLSIDAAFPYIHKRVAYKSETHTAKESEYDFGDISAGIKIKLATDPMIHLNFRYFIPSESKPYDKGTCLYQQQVSNYFLGMLNWYYGVRIPDTSMFSQYYRMNLATSSGHHVLNPAISVSKKFEKNIAFGMVSYKRYLDSKEILVAEDLSSNLNYYRFIGSSPYLDSGYVVARHKQTIKPGDALLVQLGYILRASQNYSLHAGFDYSYFFKTTLSGPGYEFKDWDYSAFGWFIGAGFNFIPQIPITVRVNAGTADADPFFTTTLRFTYMCIL